MNQLNPNELPRIHRFALMCYGWDLNSTELSIVQKVARLSVQAAPIVNTRRNYMYSVLKSIGYGYRDVMDY